ncbi:uncharacterized protein B0I36DRAFT_346930 [Microdochium trichocladiopsis]|uniref:mRNA export factor MEX67 n=1 Tax=Microdochium trichocladiopsis TaxID=1682393 RepID=A0A9P8YDK1_9PEZI|nr:uncharacterized protein B0I36DRAFT_346930 [Microdochium trichocladiopsis]KAH7035088.1 hypothetical protein B0I36DRAFT_346930 [Microdochium trichocladiopsis]
MAPPTGPRNGANNGRGGGGGKGSGRGGIAKRRAGGGRTDRDGDLDMGAGTTKVTSGKISKRTETSTKSTGASGRPTRPTRKAQNIVEKAITRGSGSLSARALGGMAPPGRGLRSQSQPSVTLKVEGLKSSKAASNEGGGLRELLTFIERKATTVGKVSRQVRVKKSQLKDDFVHITASKEDAEEILKLNGFGWAGTNLTITTTTDSPLDGSTTQMSSTALEVKEQLKGVLSVRYNVEAKLLDLGNLGQDPILSQMGFFAGESSPEKMFRALMAICDGIFKTAQAKRESVVSISLAGNNIDDVLQVMSLTDTFPDVINLDLSKNAIKDIKALQKWRHRLRHMETLLLNDNPIETTNPGYVQEITGWFPKLQNLSNQQVRSPEQVAAEQAATRPSPIPQNGADFRDINRIGEGFITEFIQMYDTNRPTLAAKYYDDQSVFSLAVNTNAPHAPDVQPPTWSAYLKFSRNHSKITHASARYQRLFVGAHLIQEAWKQLPLTRHPDIATQFDKYIIDCHPIHGLADPSGQSPLGVDGMTMTIHGELDDQEPTSKKEAKRSFSRTFILGPGAPGQNPIRVISDMLSMKVYNPLPTAAADAGTQAPTAAITAPVTQIPPASTDAEKEQFIMELCKRTNMVPEYSRFCLETANWNFDQALVIFAEKKAQLPQEAFIAGAA